MTQPWVLSHRVALHEELKKNATGPIGVGLPATLYTSSPAVAVDVANSSIVLENGTIANGDLILGADGVSVSCT